MSDGKQARRQDGKMAIGKAVGDALRSREKSKSLAHQLGLGTERIYLVDVGTSKCRRSIESGNRTGGVILQQSQELSNTMTGTGFRLRKTLVVAMKT